jgi:hypothetical protein
VCSFTDWTIVVRELSRIAKYITHMLHAVYADVVADFWHWFLCVHIRKLVHDCWPCVLTIVDYVFDDFRTYLLMIGDHVYLSMFDNVLMMISDNVFLFRLLTICFDGCCCKFLTMLKTTDIFWQCVYIYVPCTNILILTMQLSGYVYVFWTCTRDPNHSFTFGWV